MREPRPIDAYSLADEVFQSKKDNPHSDGMVRKTHNHEHENFLKMIARAPTIDAVPVVRCKDCKWYNPDTDWGFDEATGRRDHSKIVKKPYGECQGQNFHFTEDGFLRVGDDDYCSYGERRDTE